MGTLKIVADYYPARLHRAFVIDPPSLFSVMWKVTTYHQPWNMITIVLLHYCPCYC